MIIQNYRKTSVNVQAVQVTTENVKEVATWCGGVVVEEIDPLDNEKRFVAINYPTIKGLTRVSEGDYLLRGPQGGFSTSPAAEFERLYEVI